MPCRPLATLVLACALACVGPAQAAEPRIDRTERNPPPAEPLAAFDRFEVEPVALADGLDDHRGNVVAQRYLQVDLDERVPKLLATRDRSGEGGRTLLIRPKISDIRFITGGKRLVFGGFAGKSWAVLRLELVDKATGEVIAEPRFQQHANSLLAGYSLGAADKLMLARLADMAAAYLADNFEQPVGSAVALEAPPMD